SPPSPSQGGSSSQLRSQSRISVACFMCQKRKIKCSSDGTYPCANCQRRHWSCRFNFATDRRRTAASRHALMQQTAEAVAQVQRQREMIGGIVAIIRDGERKSTDQLIHLIRTTQDLRPTASFVRGELHTDAAVQSAYQAIDWQGMQL
ncbi:hypothetical protein A1O3_04766, partial [Capronia epimyces CBS 606.96]